MNETQVSVILPAAGNATRMAGLRKTYFSLAGVPVLIRALQAFDGIPFVGELIVVAKAEEHPECQALLEQYEWETPILLAEGGATRQESVQNGLAASSDAFPYVAIHDAARPLVARDDIIRACEMAFSQKAAALGVPVKDTIKRVAGELIVDTPNRQELIAIQTPQVFEKALYRRGIEAAKEAGKDYTDDCQLVEALGAPVAVVLGADTNIKVTTPADLPVAEALIGKEQTTMNMRIGHGYDVHRLIEGRALILGGVTIPYEKGLDGHSDADVLAHAITDALLGGAAMGDIGRHFPDTDPAYRGADSLKLLAHAVTLLKEQGYRPVNVDATILAQAPKLAPHIPAMREKLAAAMALPIDAVSVKATTEERLGFTGSGEGMAAHAVCLLTK